jgi:hypothetical protein
MPKTPRSGILVEVQEYQGVGATNCLSGMENWRS